MSIILADAARATELVEQHVGRVIALLKDVAINDQGVFSDPNVRFAVLRGAQVRLDEAIDVMRATRWPARGDYNPFGEGEV